MFALVSPNKITRDTGEPFRKRLKQNAAALRFAADHSAQGKANEIIDILQKDVHFSPDVVAQHADDMLLLEVIEVGHDFRRELLCMRIQKNIIPRCKFQRRCCDEENSDNAISRSLPRFALAIAALAFSTRAALAFFSWHFCMQHD